MTQHEHELDIFRGLDLSEVEGGELTDTPHRTLLEEAFQALRAELYVHGNSADFLKLRALHSKKLIQYWHLKLNLYNQALLSGQIIPSQHLITKDEDLVVLGVTGWMDDDEKTLLIERRTELEEDKVTITVMPGGKIDCFGRPPTIISRIQSDPDEPYDLYFKITFGHNRFKAEKGFIIERLERKKIHVDPKHQRPFIYDTRVINCTATEFFDV